MARPRKLSDAEMLKIVDSFYESNGNPNMLKCSLLEEYALSLGINIMAYDFRRSEVVRRRMDELKSSIKSVGGAIAYKSLDVDAMLNRNRTREALRSSLLELDESWRGIYERAEELSAVNKSLFSDVFSKKQTIEALITDKETFEMTVKGLEKTSNALLLENRYLKRMLKTYLYPAVANEILKNENVLEQVDTDVTQIAMDTLTEPATPTSFSSSVSTDMDTISRTEYLLRRMRNQISGGDDNA